jgi:hypothetical protein
MRLGRARSVDEATLVGTLADRHARMLLPFAGTLPFTDRQRGAIVWLAHQHPDRQARLSLSALAEKLRGVGPD